MSSQYELLRSKGQEFSRGLISGTKMGIVGSIPGLAVSVALAAVGVGNDTSTFAGMTVAALIMAWLWRRKYGDMVIGS